MILLIDSEILRKPFNQKYCYPQDQQAISGCWQVTEKAAEKYKIYGIINYGKLPKNSMLDLAQAKYYVWLFPEFISGARWMLFTG